MCVKLELILLNVFKYLCDIIIIKCCSVNGMKICCFGYMWSNEWKNCICKCIY